ncbi:MAG: hypothetical protein K2N39_02020, partial [Lachnospiraceae bacterium]|nr:hypothetical protein [Lachnospiraceae bacterium]
MLVVNLVPAAGIAAAFGMGIYEGQPDYQESGEFRELISEKLSELIGVATGGKAYSGYFTDSTGAVYKFMDESYDEWVEEFQNGSSVQQEDVVEETADYGAAADFLNNLEGPETFGGNWDDYQAYLAEEQAYYDEMTAAEYGLGSAYDYDGYYGGYSDYYDYNFDDKESRDAYMADAAQNKNLRYAVIYQNKLLYSNIEGFEERAGEEWKGEDFAEALDAGEYNFTLWYNRAGDGKVQIVKDGHEENVYGDGVYSDSSRWRVPGYANFTIGESAREAVIFLAAARSPQLYLVRSDESSRVTQYGGSINRMKQNAVYLQSAAERIGVFMTAGLILLAAALLMRKSRRRAAEWIGDFLGKICLEMKLLLLFVMTVFFVGTSAGALGHFVRWIGNGFSYYYWSGDYLYETARLTEAGAYLAIWFWLFYLIVLDWRMNGKKQKKPLFDLLKVKDFKYPIQKRLVRRQRLILIAELSLIVLFAVAVSAMWLFMGEYMTYLTDGYNYSYTYDVYEAVAEDQGYSLGLAGAYMAYLLMPCIVFTALFVFTSLTFCSLKKNYRLAVDIGALTDQILAVREGNLTEELTLSEETDLREAADNLNQIQKGMETALSERMKSERMKVDLVTN